MEVESKSMLGTQAIARAISILRAVSRHADGARLTDLVENTGLSAPTVRRILLCLMDEQVVEQRSDTRRYQLGPLIAELGLNTVSHRTRAGRCQPVLDRLAEETGCTIYLNIRSGYDTVVVARAISDRPVRITNVDVGSRFPIGVGPGGVNMLAAMRPDEADEVIGVVAPLLSSYGGLDVTTLRSEIEFARKQKYAFNRERVIAGISGLGVTVPKVAGWPPIALTVVSLTEYIQGDRRDWLVKQMRTAVREIAAALSL